MPNKRFETIYSKPFLRGLDGVSPEEILKRLKFSIIARVRRKVLASTFSDRAKKAFSKALVAKTGPSSVTFHSAHPGFRNMLRGRKQKQMKWLTKARTPIPIMTEDGELIFRTATVKSMRSGKWVHPGRPAHDFVHEAKKEAMLHVRARVLKDLERIASGASKKKIRL